MVAALTLQQSMFPIRFLLMQFWMPTWFPMSNKSTFPLTFSQQMAWLLQKVATDTIMDSDLTCLQIHGIYSCLCRGEGWGRYTKKSVTFNMDTHINICCNTIHNHLVTCFLYTQYFSVECTLWHLCSEPENTGLGRWNTQWHPSMVLSEPTLWFLFNKVTSPAGMNVCCYYNAVTCKINTHTLQLHKAD